MENDSQTQPAGGMREVLAPPRVPGNEATALGRQAKWGLYL